MYVRIIEEVGEDNSANLPKNVHRVTVSLKQYKAHYSKISEVPKSKK